MFFNDVNFLDGGYLGIPTRSCILTGGKLIWRAQNPCVLRLQYGVSTNTSYAVVTTTVGGNSVQVTVAMNVGKTMYVPLNETFLSLFSRVKNNALALSGVTGTLTIEEYNSVGTVINTLTYTIIVCDSGGIPPVDIYQAYAHILPDTFLFPDDKDYHQSCFVTARFIGGIDEFDIRDSAGTNLDVYTRTYSDTSSASREILFLTSPATMAALTSGGDMETARFEYKTMCHGEEILVMWWSPVDGGWKSRIAEVMGLTDGINRDMDYTRLYEIRLGKSVSGGLSCRFPLLSERDYSYYRDVLMSDEVYLVTKIEEGSMIKKMRQIPVRITGDFPANGRNRNVDFNVIFNDYTEI